MAKYSFDENYFDNIDCGEKAYWLGFIWGDGYVAKRERKSYVSYETKLHLKESDCEHLEKFKLSIKSNHELKRYIVKGFGVETETIRLLIANKHFGLTLYEKYGIIPYRIDCSKILSILNSEFYKDFIRGVFDADGSIVLSHKEYKNSYSIEPSINFIGHDMLLDFINKYLIDNGLTETSYARCIRHEGMDNGIMTIKITGTNVCYKILNHIYNNNSCLDRKYDKFLILKEDMIRRGVRV